MKKKTVIIILVSGVVLAAGAFGAFKWYMNSHKASSEIANANPEHKGEKEETTAGKTINSFGAIEGTYKSEITDPVSSEIMFTTSGVTATQGKFKAFKITADFAGVENTKLNVTIEAKSIYTAESTRDSHLRGEDFFNVEKYPNIVFESSSIVKGDTSYIAKGSLSMLGKTNEITVPFIYDGTSSSNADVEVFRGTFEIKPGDYGMSDDAGESVLVDFETQLKKQ